VSGVQRRGKAIGTKITTRMPARRSDPAVEKEKSMRIVQEHQT
jgi:hypothetical protein